MKKTNSVRGVCKDCARWRPRVACVDGSCTFEAKLRDPYASCECFEKRIEEIKTESKPCIE
jgi:hypothetical protein